MRHFSGNPAHNQGQMALYQEISRLPEHASVVHPECLLSGDYQASGLAAVLYPPGIHASWKTRTIVETLVRRRNLNYSRGDGYFGHRGWGSLYRLQEHMVVI